MAAGNPYTAGAGVRALEAGGNAVDAAIAAMFAACVAEPMLTDIGGGGYLLVDRGDTATVYDFFVRVPGLGAAARPAADAFDFRPLTLDFGDTQQVFQIGWGSAAVPGNPHGLCTAHAREGVLPLTEVVAPAVELGRAGVPLTEEMELILSVIGPIFLESDILSPLIAPEGRLLRAGERLRFSEAADLLEALGREGHRLFYEGEVGAAIVRECNERGGLITAEDLASYETAIRAPLETEFCGARVRLNAPPSTGGPLIGFGLDVATAAGWHDSLDTANGATTLAAILATTAQARADRMDPLLLTTGYEEHVLGRPAVISEYVGQMNQLLDVGRIARGGRSPDNPRGNTTHVSAVDEDGLVASITTSNGEGSACCIPGYGIHLNNMLGEEDLNPGGFHQYGPGERLPSMMCPAVVQTADGRRTALGSGGANRLRTAILQVLLRIVHGQSDVQSAVDASRIHYDHGQFDLEAGLPEGAAEAIADLGRPVRQFRGQNLYFGGVHTAQWRPDGTFDGAGDARRGGRVARSSVA